jgi:hypothetical protein
MKSYDGLIGYMGLQSECRVFDKLGKKQVIVRSGSKG